MTPPLNGVRVLEVAQWVFVPGATAILADWGAEVIKVEHPIHADPQRNIVTSGVGPDVVGFNYMFDQENRGKKSIGLDIASERGREILYGLVARSDVFATNFLPTARTKLKIDVEDIRRHNENIVYLRGTGQGHRGSERDKGGYDSATFWSRGGVAHHTTPPGAVPIPQRPGFGDHVSSLAVAGAIAAGLVARANGGAAPVIDVSLLSSALWALAPDIVAAGAVPGGLPYITREKQSNPLVNFYQTADERWLRLHLMQSDRFWPELCRHIDRGDLAEDPRFATARERAEHRVELTAELDTTFAKRSLDQWRAALEPMEGVWAPLQTATELHRDPQVLANEYLREIDYDGVKHSFVASPAQFDETPFDLRRAPEAGEDTEPILLELGLSWTDIAELKEDATIT
jgi:crotonobetainyl-CoA:carnitine CoA-transferase CaiB-like acyl-CoA transferase